MNIFWEQRVVPNVVKAGAKSISEANAALAGGVDAVEVCFQWRCRYYPFHRPSRPSLVPFDYINKRYVVWLNPDIDFITDFSFSAPVGDLCFHLQDTVYTSSLVKGFPVGLFKKRITLSAESIAFKEGHPILPVFNLTGVVLSENLRAEMHRMPEPPPHKFTFIVQQCNCLTLKPLKEAASIILKHPEMGPYKDRVAGNKRKYMAKEECRGVPGTIYVVGNVASFMAQWRPGRADSPYFRRYPESDPPETAEQREKWFQECLDHLGELCQEVVDIAFPNRISCQLAAGNWEHYENLIARFATSLPEGSRVHITENI